MKTQSKKLIDLMITYEKLVAAEKKIADQKKITRMALLEAIKDDTVIDGGTIVALKTFKTRNVLDNNKLKVALGVVDLDEYKTQTEYFTLTVQSKGL